jgi:carboxymethylenebutenolidase
MHGYMAIPAKAHGRQPAVMVVHGTSGLDDYTRDLARRIALAGFVTCAPDFLSMLGGSTPDAVKAQATIDRLDFHQTVADAVATIRWLGSNRYATGKVGALGFFWGGGLVNRIAIASGPALTAAVSYYGPAPDPAGAGNVKAAMMLHVGGHDARTDAGGRRWAAALQAAGVPTQAYFYEGADAGFDDGTPARQYDTDEAKLAWDRTLAFLEEYLR